MISKKTVDAILETAQIEQVVGDFVNLKRRGTSLIGLCPFHHEKTPSFNVSTNRGIYKCFGCGKGGGPLHFVMEHENCSYPEALRYLAQKYNIPIEEDEQPDGYKEKMQLADSLYIVNKAAQEYYSHLLFHNKYAKDVGLAYFKERGLREDIIKAFELGFANGDNADMLKHLQSQQFDPAIMEQAGLLNQYGKDFFRQRVLFPIHNVAGKVVGFGGRTMSSDKSVPKYINSRETEIYIKNKTLYALHLAKKAISQRGEVWLTEGYMDVVSLHQAGFSHVVASAGTSLTEEQVKLLKRYTENVVILYDGDAAGIAAAEKAVNLFLENDMNPQVLLFPAPEDPDSYVRKVGSAAFERYVSEKKSNFIDFKLQISPAINPNDPLAKVKLSQELTKLLAKIKDPFKRSVFVQYCGEKVGLSEAQIHQEVNKLIVKNIEQNAQKQPVGGSEAADTQPEPNYQQPEPKNTNTDSPQRKQDPQERDVVRLLVQFGQLPFTENSSVAEFVLENMLDFLTELENPLYTELMVEYMRCLDEGQSPTADYFINHPNPEFRALAVDLLAATVQYEYSPNWARWNIYLQSQKMPDKNHLKDAYSGVTRLKLKKMERLCAQNQQKLKELSAEKSTDEERYTNAMILLRTQMKLNSIRAELAKELNTVVLR